MAQKLRPLFGKRAEVAAAAANDALEHGKELATDAAKQTAAAVSTLAKAWDGLHGSEAATYLGKRAEAPAAAATAAASDAFERVFKEVATDAADHTAAAFSNAFRKAWDKLHGSEAQLISVNAPKPPLQSPMTASNVAQARRRRNIMSSVGETLQMEIGSGH